MTTPPPRLVPDRPSDAAIAKAFRELDKLTGPQYPANSYAWVMRRAREIDAAAPPAEAPAERGEAHFWLIERACAAAIGGSEWAGMHPVSKAAARNRLHAALAAAPAAPAEGDAKQALGEYLTEKLPEVAPDVDWQDGRYMEQLVDGAFAAMATAPRVTGGRDCGGDSCDCRSYCIQAATGGEVE